MASVASAVAEVLRARGVDDLPASLAAEAGIAVFKVTFARWTSETGRDDLAGLIRESFEELKAVTAGR